MTVREVWTAPQWTHCSGCPRFIQVLGGPWSSSGLAQPLLEDSFHPVKAKQAGQGLYELKKKKKEINGPLHTQCGKADGISSGHLSILFWWVLPVLYDKRHQVGRLLIPLKCGEMVFQSVHGTPLRQHGAWGTH